VTERYRQRPNKKSFLIMIRFKKNRGPSAAFPLSHTFGRAPGSQLVVVVIVGNHSARNSPRSLLVPGPEKVRESQVVVLQSLGGRFYVCVFV